MNEDGTKLGWRAAVVRNVARIVDAFPYVFPYLVGAISVWASPNQQRLGDRWANTVVVTKESMLPRAVGDPVRPRPAAGNTFLHRLRPTSPRTSLRSHRLPRCPRGRFLRTTGYHWVWSAPSASVPVQSPSATRYSVSSPATCFR